MSTFISLRLKKKKDVQRICDRCITCRQDKSKVMPHGLYTPLPVLKEPWVDISMDFILGLPRSRTHFIAYYKTDDATNIIDLFFRKVI